MFLIKFRDEIEIVCYKMFQKSTTGVDLYIMQTQTQNITHILYIGNGEENLY